MIGAMKKASKPRPGDVYQVPVSPGYAYVVVARVKPGSVLGYFFLSPQPLTSADLVQIQACQADEIQRVAELPFSTGRWPLVAGIPRWDAAAWPVPEFHHQDLIEGHYVLRSYDDRLRFTGERGVSEEEALSHPRDGQAGGLLWQEELSALAAHRFGGGEATAVPA